MLVEHTCISCAAPLRHVRARFHESLRLFIVTCPRCGTSCVRAAHTITRGRRRAVQFLLTSIAMAFKVVMFVFFVSAIVASLQEFSVSLQQAGLEPLDIWRPHRMHAGETVFSVLKEKGDLPILGIPFAAGIGLCILCFGFCSHVPAWVHCIVIAIALTLGVWLVNLPSPPAVFSRAPMDAFHVAWLKTRRDIQTVSFVLLPMMLAWPFARSVARARERRVAARFRTLLTRSRKELARL